MEIYNYITKTVYRIVEYFFYNTFYTRINKTNIELHYYFKDIPYKVIFPKVIGQRTISHIDSICGVDLMDTLGPFGNFHNIPTTPKLLGYPEGVVVHRRDGRNETFTNEEIINI